MFIRDFYNNLFSGVDNVVNEHMQTKLMRAAIDNDLKQVQALVKQKASLDLQDYKGETALSLAVQCGHDEIASYLIDQKAQLNTPGNYYRTPLMLACESGNLLLVSKLIEAKADVNIQTKDGSTALDLVIFGGEKMNNVDVAAILVANGARINRPDNLLKYLTTLNEKKPTDETVFKALHEFYLQQTDSRENPSKDIPRLNDEAFRLLESMYNKHPSYAINVAKNASIIDEGTGSKLPKVLLSIMAEYLGPTVPKGPKGPKGS